MTRRAWLRLTATGAALAAAGQVPAAGLAVRAQAATPSPPTGPEVRHPAIDGLFSRYRRSDAPGIALAVVRDGETLHLAGYGAANLESGEPIDGRTVFHAASLAKQFTAFSIGLLEEDGALGLDDDIHRYLPDVPDFGARITLRHLLHHTSGLRDQWPMLVLAGHDRRDVLTQARIRKLVAAQRELNFTPGTAHEYCNTGYTLLAEVVARISGQSFPEFAEQRIFRPLNMTRTFFCDDAGRIVRNSAASYHRRDNGTGWRHVPLNYETVGATGLCTTAEDMLRWAGNFNEPVVGGVKLMRRLGQPGHLRDSHRVNYGHGLYRHRFAGHEAVYHRGRDAGFVAAFAWIPKLSLGVVLLANTPVDQDELTDAVTLYCCGQAAGGGSSEPLRSRPSPRQLSNLTGHYLGADGHMLTLRREGDGLWLSDRLGEDEPVTVRNDGSFDTGGRRRGYYRPCRNASGRVTAIEEVRPDAVAPRVSTYQRAARTRPSDDRLAELAGLYHSAELDCSYRLTVSDGGLLLDCRWLPRPERFRPTVNDHFQTSHRVLASMQVVRDQSGSVGGLLLHGHRYRNLRLDRVSEAAC
ncbi:beta-lactamase family protein [Methylonatrum kenyense]|uniref:serine hydrolase domain-containing protein n=1 Tax=Methylonatrum kenyense TaxID=455253 RepID=UPI0020BE8405|nr:serine hydrolase domain-containing protein [Methylonatrum kenyense]MCK8517221.1 beta-lactamase family protein [Methylonatrum kenyense]